MDPADVVLTNLDNDEYVTVTNVWVSSQSWTSSFLNYLQTSGVGDTTHGYAVPVGSSDQLKPLPWFNIDQVAIQFSENVVVSQSDLDLVGLRGCPKTIPL